MMDENTNFNPILYRKKLKKYDIQFKGIPKMIKSFEGINRFKRFSNDNSADSQLSKKVMNIWRFIFILTFFSLHISASYLGKKTFFCKLIDSVFSQLK
jgi:hypothetical protein